MATPPFDFDSFFPRDLPLREDEESPRKPAPREAPREEVIATPKPEAREGRATRPEERVLTVTELVIALQRAVAGAFPKSVWIEGEASGVKFVDSGYVYFTLKDRAAAVACVVSRKYVEPNLREILVDGAQVRVRGRGDIFPSRGQLQFAVERVERTGEGAQKEALERLKRKLHAEGLFDEGRKRPLPSFPRVIGVVTSETGAVIHDIAKVAFSRGPARILLSPAIVQGERAAESIRRAFLLLSKVAEVDVIIVGRGGGSAEDLSAFNDETLVRAVAACGVPVVSAVGHQVDVTLLDFVADARASTPSQAAEKVVVSEAKLRADIEQRRLRLDRSLRARHNEARVELLQSARRLSDPRVVVHRSTMLLDDRRTRLRSLLEARLRSDFARLADCSKRLDRADPAASLAADRRKFDALSYRLMQMRTHLLRDRQAKFAETVASLDALSPLRVLGRGYALVRDEKGRVIVDANKVKRGTTLHIRVASGTLFAKTIAQTEPTKQLELIPLDSDPVEKSDS
ncbi:MAG: exodeoxyribonuclease VII large subunit [Polyangiaceae bacterium]|nr:exodeoxyribonuclease VII large subunit [Polyangiaceae bacterium]